MEKNLIKRILSVILATVIAVGAVPFTALPMAAEMTNEASDEVTEEVTNEASDEVTEETTNEVTDDVTDDTTEEVTGNVTENGLTYSIENGEVTVTGYIGTECDVEIDAYIEGYPVTSIGREAFKENTIIRSIIIPETIRQINSYAFYKCVDLESVSFGEGVKTIGSSAFSGCLKLDNIALPDGITKIDISAFFDSGYYRNDDNWEDGVLYIGNYLIRANSGISGDLTLKSTTTLISNDAFSYCTNLTGITIPEGVIGIGSYAFSNCSNLTDISLSEGVRSIGVSAFVNTGYYSNRENWENGILYIGSYLIDAEETVNGDVAVKSGTTLIADYAFMRCTGMTSVTLPAEAEYIGSYAFSNCSSLVNIDIPHNVSSIGQYAFSYCAALKSVILPRRMTEIAEGTFNVCMGLISITVPKGIIQIGSYAFSNCLELNCVFYTGTFEEWSSISIDEYNSCFTDAVRYYEFFAVVDDFVCAFDEENATVSISEYIGSSEEVVVPLEVKGYPVTAIVDFAFADCESLKKIYLPEGLKAIGDSAFKNCRKLADLIIPNGMVSIGDNAFENCIGLNAINLPNGLKSIGSDAFYGCVNIFIVYIEEINTILNISFGNKYSNPMYARSGKLYVNGEQAMEIVIPEGTTCINDFAFCGIESFSYIVIPESVTKIGMAAFDIAGQKQIFTVYYTGSREEWYEIEIGDYNSRLINATIYFNYWGETKDYILSIDKEAQTLSIEKYIGSQSNVVIPSEIEGYPVTAIGPKAFYLNRKVTQITLHEDITRIGYQAFEDTGYYNNSNNWEDGVLYIGNFLIKASNTVSGEYTIKDTTVLIADYAFRSCSKLTGVIIPESITSISTYAFSYCSQLSNIGFHDGITNIEENAFYNCSSLTSITLPGSIANIGENAFSNCRNIESVTVPANSISFGESAFGACQSLSAVYIEDLQAWCKNKFADSSSTPLGSAGNLYLNGELVREVVFSEEIVKVEDYVFYGSKSIERVNLHDGITAIGDYAFYSCSSLTNITISEELTYIGGYAFYSCAGLTSIDLSGKITYIGDNAFSGCRGLTNLTIPAGVIGIGKNAFFYCNGLESVTFLGKNVSIGDSAFSNCSNLKAVYIEDLQDWLGNTFDNSYANPLSTAKALYLNGELITKLVIPEGIESINAYAFLNCHKIKQVIFPESLTKIENSAFSNCSVLKTMGYVGTAEQWGNVAVGDNKSLTLAKKVYNYLASDDTFMFSLDVETNTAFLSAYMVSDGIVVIPATVEGITVTGIDDNVFKYNDNIRSITIPAGVTYIGKDNFYDCSELRNVYIEDISAWCGMTFANEYSSPFCQVYLRYPRSLYLNGELINDLVIPEGTTSIASYAFYNIEHFYSITVPASVTSIGQNAFYNSYSLKKVYYYGSAARWNEITNGLALDTDMVFNYGTELEGLIYVLDEETQSVMITDYTGSAEDFVIPEMLDGCAVTGIGNDAFDGCSFLKSITLPDSLTSIGYGAFGKCSALSSISIPDGVITIGDNAFYSCSNITTITIPASVASIGNNTFGNCSGVRTINYYGTYTQWKALTKNVNTYYIRYADVICNYGTDIAGLEYDIDEEAGVVTITGIADGLVNVTIPATIEGYTVTAIGDSAFRSCNKLTSLTLPETLISIGSHSFYYCSALTSINIPASVTSIGAQAFSSCERITAIYVDDIGAWCNIEFKEYSSNPLYFAKNLYLNGELAGDISVPEGTTTIKAYAFYGCESLTGISIPASVTSIGDRAFYNCTGLVSISISEGVESIGECAFYGCESLTGIIIPVSVTSIGKGAFAYCIALTEITVPGGVTSFGQSVFADCTGLESVVISEGITALPNMFFDNCNNLKTVTLPSSIRELSGSCIDVCGKLEKIYYCGSKTEWCNVYSFSLSEVIIIYNYGTDIEGYDYVIGYDYTSKTSCITITGYYGTEIYCVIPSEIEGYPVTGISEAVFSGRTDMKTVTFPDAELRIGKDAFYNCTSLYAVYAPSVSGWCTDIIFMNEYSNPLYYAKALYVDGKLVTDVDLTDEWATIRAYAFAEYTHLKTVTLRGASAAIYNYAFRNCTALTDVTIYGALDWSGIGDYAFLGCKSLKTVRYGRSLDDWKSKYSSSTNNELSKATVIPHYATAFEGFTYTTNYSNRSITITRYNGSCEDLVIPSSFNGYTVTKIAADAFPEGCGIKSIVIPASVTSVEYRAFNQCRLLKKVYYGSTKEDWLNISVANGNSYLRNATIVYDVVVSDDGIVYTVNGVNNTASVLMASKTLRNYSIPESYNGMTVTSVGSNAFENCTRLESIELSKEITSIGIYAFYKCSALKRVSYDGKKSDWNNISKGYGNDALLNAKYTFSVVMGDLSGDGEVNAKDSNLFKRVIAGATEISKDSPEFEAVDLNGDGELNAKDSNLLKRIIAGALQL